MGRRVRAVPSDRPPPLNVGVCLKRVQRFIQRLYVSLPLTVCVLRIAQTLAVIALAGALIAQCAAWDEVTVKAGCEGVKLVGREVGGGSDEGDGLVRGDALDVLEGVVGFDGCVGVGRVTGLGQGQVMVLGWVCSLGKGKGDKGNKGKEKDENGGAHGLLSRFDLKKIKKVSLWSVITIGTQAFSCSDSDQVQRAFNACP